MIEINEVLLKSNDSWLHFSQPYKIIHAGHITEVTKALREIEELVIKNEWHAAGFISYEAAPAFDPSLQVLPNDNFPLLWFGLYPQPKEIELPLPVKSVQSIDWQASMRQEGYNIAIGKIKDYIAKGKTYQVNYTMRLKADFNQSAWDFFLQLAQSQNKYAAYLNMGHYAICSASPELFFSLNGKTITSHPMKGTVKRGKTIREDKEQANWLANSIKNRAENVMIVDMIRNDLGKIAEIGSVQVPKLFEIEKYSTLFQMTSMVQAKTKASITEIFTALFPCASITGAPKVSTMNIILELETTPRKIYTGSIGYIAPNRQAQFNVAIRTALIDLKSKTAEYGVGGGIVWDSTSTDEYGEALLKARVLSEKPQEFSLIETLLWTPQTGYFLFDRHIKRMMDSAEYFGFKFSEKETISFLKNLIPTEAATDLRVRILLTHAGEISGEVKRIQKQTVSFRGNLAKVPVHSENIFLYHKTTRREMYPSSSGMDFDDTLLFNEKDELTEFTIGNLVVEINGQLWTPPASCGLLAGTFRAHLLETGEIKEKVVYKKELSLCTKIYLINSVRKWVEVII